MKKILIVVILACISLTFHSQSRKIKEFVIQTESILSLPINNQHIIAYENLQRDIKQNRYTNYGGHKKLKDQLALSNIEKRVLDSVSLQYKRKDAIQLKDQERIEVLRRDSITLASKIAEQYAQDSIRIVQELKEQKNRAIQDSINKVRSKGPDFKVIEGKGSGAFSNFPNTLAQIFKKNATVESIVATFQRYRAYYCCGIPEWTKRTFL